MNHNIFTLQKCCFSVGKILIGLLFLLAAPRLHAQTQYYYVVEYNGYFLTYLGPTGTNDNPNVLFTPTFDPVACVWTSNQSLTSTTKGYLMIDNHYLTNPTTPYQSILAGSSQLNTWGIANSNSMNRLFYNASSKDWYPYFDGNSLKYLTDKSPNNNYDWAQVYTVTPTTLNKVEVGRVSGCEYLCPESNCLYTISKNARYVTLTNYSFKDYSFDIENSSTEAGITYTWSLEDISSDYATIDNSTGEVHYTQAVSEVTHAQVKLTATHTTSSKSAVAVMEVDFLPTTITTPTIDRTDIYDNMVKISSDPYTNIYYTVDGSTPTEASNLYSGPFAVSEARATIKAVAVRCGSSSEVGSLTFENLAVAAPDIDWVATGTTASVTLSGEEGASIYYQVNGTADYDNLPETTYSASFTIHTGDTVYAYATKDGYNHSLIASKVFLVSGVKGSTLVINDMEDNTWTYYKPMSEGGIKGISNPSPRNVKITYQGGSVSGGSSVALSRDENINCFMYYRTVERDEDGKYTYSTIYNPFLKRPATGSGTSKQYYGFSTWRITKIANGKVKYGENTWNAGSSLTYDVPAGAKIEFVPDNHTDNAIDMEVEMVARWSQAAVITCASNSVNSYLSNSSLNKGSAELNFIVVTTRATTSNTTEWNKSGQKPVTITCVYPDGNNAMNTSVYVDPNSITLYNDMRLENLYINSTSATINANGYNLAIGRGVSNTTSSSLCAKIIKGIGGEKTSNLNYTMRVESGVYEEIRFYDGTPASAATYRCSGTDNHVNVVLGNDYDRARGDNAKLNVKNYVAMGRGAVLNQQDVSKETLRCVVKSGKYSTSITNDNAKYEECFFLGTSNDYGTRTTYEGHTGIRKVTIEGGEFLSMCGGPDNHNNDDDTVLVIRMKGGLLNGSLYLAGDKDKEEARGQHKLIMTGGQIKGWVAGGGNGSDGGQSVLPVDTYVYIGGSGIVGNKGGTVPTINGINGGIVFGAGSGNSTYPESGRVNRSFVAVADQADVQNNVYGGGYNGYTRLKSTVYVTGGEVRGSVFGGSYLKGGVTTEVNVSGGEVKGSVFGGSHSQGIISDSTVLHITGGVIGTEGGDLDGVFGGGKGSDTRVLGSVSVVVGEEKAQSGAVIYGDVYGGSAEGKTNGDESRTTDAETNVTLNAGTIHGSLYGGGLGTIGTDGHPADVYGPVKVTVNGGSVKKTDETDANGSGGVYGCNNVNGAPKLAVSVDIYGTDPAPDDNEYAIYAVYGGGNQSDYEYSEDNSPSVTVHNCNNSIEYIYGGGNAADVKNTYVTIYGGNKIGNVFGGGNGESGTAANVTGDIGTYVMIYGGTIGNVYGGSNSKGRIEGDISVIISPSAETTIGNDYCPIEIGNVYGGGNEAPSKAGRLTISCGDMLTYDFHIGNVYGGANKADINGDIELYITAGNIDNVFGGNNNSGNINGSITVNIEESYPSCGMEVGNVYGGGNLAVYSVYGYNNEGAPETTGTAVEDPQVNIIGGTITGNVFGAGKGNGTIVPGSTDVYTGHLFGNTKVKMTGGSCKNIFGGGEGAPVSGNTNVLVNVGTPAATGKHHIEECVFGGGLGAAAVIGGNTKVTITGSTAIGKNVYGGGNAGEVRGSTHIDIGGVVSE